MEDIKGGFFNFLFRLPSLRPIYSILPSNNKLEHSLPELFIGQARVSEWVATPMTLLRSVKLTEWFEPHTVTPHPHRVSMAKCHGVVWWCGP